MTPYQQEELRRAAFQVTGALLDGHQCDPGLKERIDRLAWALDTSPGWRPWSNGIVDDALTGAFMTNLFGFGKRSRLCQSIRPARPAKATAARGRRWSLRPQSENGLRLQARRPPPQPHCRARSQKPLPESWLKPLRCPRPRLEGGHASAHSTHILIDRKVRLRRELRPDPVPVSHQRLHGELG